MAQEFHLLLIDDRGRAVRIGLQDLIAAGRDAGSDWEVEARDATFHGMLFSSLVSKRDGRRVPLAVPRIILRILQSPPLEPDFRLHAGAPRLIVEGDDSSELDYPEELRPRLEADHRHDSVLVVRYPSEPVLVRPWGMRWLTSLLHGDLDSLDDLNIRAHRGSRAEMLRISGGSVSMSESARSGLAALMMLLSGSAYGYGPTEPALYLVLEALRDHYRTESLREILHMAGADFVRVSLRRFLHRALRSGADMPDASGGSRRRIQEARLNGRWAGLPLKITGGPGVPDDPGSDRTFRDAAVCMYRELSRLSGIRTNGHPEPDGGFPSWSPNRVNGIVAVSGDMVVDDSDLHRRLRKLDVPAIHLISVPKDRIFVIRVFLSAPGRPPEEVTQSFWSRFHPGDGEV